MRALRDHPFDSPEVSGQQLADCDGPVCAVSQLLFTLGGRYLSIGSSELSRPPIVRDSREHGNDGLGRAEEISLYVLGLEGRVKIFGLTRKGSCSQEDLDRHGTIKTGRP